jgi:hypothetical protein
MDLRKSDRATLKGYFVKNAVPTAGNFAELIDGQLNQREDGIAKLPGEPLSLQAEVAGAQKTLNFYKSFAQDKPAWTLSLNPGRPGWSVDGADGRSRLFIDEATGGVGVGTVEPGTARLRVAGGFKADANASGERPVTMEPPADANHRGSGTQAATGLVYRTAGNPAAGEPIFQVRSEGQAVRFFVEHDGWTGSRDNSAWFGGARINYFKGNVGIGIFEPLAKLEVVGAAGVSNGNRYAIPQKFMAAGSLTVGSIDTDYGGGTRGWQANTAGLLLEAKDNTEIAVNDADKRVASLLYYEGDAVNRITIGRNMGWDAIREVVVNGAVSMPGSLKAKSLRVTHYNARITKKQTLSNKNSWADVPELEVKVVLTQDAEVTVFYGLTSNDGGGAPDGNSHIVTRLIWGTTELPESRSIAGNVTYWSPSGAWAGTLGAGSHVFKVQYRTPKGCTIDPASDWQKGALTATVYGAG